MRKVTFLAATLALALCPGAAGNAQRVLTVARIRTHVTGFAQDARYLVWVARTTRRYSICDAVTFLDLATGKRVTAGPSPRARDCAAASGGSDIVVAGDRAYWTYDSGSNLTYYSDLYTTAVHDRKNRDLDFQSISNEGFDVLVPPASDGRSAYFWSSPEDIEPGPIVRYDGRRRRRITRTIAALWALAAGGGRVAAAEAKWRYDCAHDPAWSPDGKRIAYASYGSRSCVGGLWLMNADGTGARRIGNGREPDWSPDGTRLAYDDPAGAVVVANADGSDPHVVVSSAADPAWSPDGTRIAFTRGTSLYVAASDGSAERLVTADAVQPDWSPDGTLLVFARPAAATPGLAIVAADGTGARTLTSGGDSQPAWSPDGRSIAFTHCADAHRSCPGDVTEIDVIAPNGTGRRAVGVDSDETSDSAPSWAPDSRGLAFVRERDWEDAGDAHIWTMAPAHRLTRTPPPLTPVVLRSRVGKRLATFEPGGVVAQVAVTAQVAAAVVREGTRWQVQIFAPIRRVVTLDRRPSSFTASGATLLLNDRRSIFAVDARTGRRRLVARAATAPLGLSLVGRRVAWAENLRRGARIRTVELR